LVAMDANVSTGMLPCSSSTIMYFQSRFITNIN
jgi:hypothetical protein